MQSNEQGAEEVWKEGNKGRQVACFEICLVCGGTKCVSPFPLSSLLLGDEKSFAVTGIKSEKKKL